MIWSDYLIKHNRLLTPFNDELVQPNSYDLTLDNVIEVDGVKVELPYLMKPNNFILGSTIETVKLPNKVVAQVDGKSSLGRKGLIVHFTAGWIDAGFKGQITLEMMCVNKPILLEAGMKIAQIIFQDAHPSTKLYGECKNHYQNQKGATKAWDE